MLKNISNSNFVRCHFLTEFRNKRYTYGGGFTGSLGGRGGIGKGIPGGGNGIPGGKGGNGMELIPVFPDIE